MTITPIETIKREAEQAAENGQSRDYACRFPFGSVEALHFKQHYEAAGGPFAHALAAYRAAIGVDAA